MGPVLEDLLHSLGFYHFDQLAAWTPAEVAWVDDNLEGFKGPRDPGTSGFRRRPTSPMAASGTGRVAMTEHPMAPITQMMWLTGFGPAMMVGRMMTEAMMETRREMDPAQIWWALTPLGMAQMMMRGPAGSAEIEENGDRADGGRGWAGEPPVARCRSRRAIAGASGGDGSRARSGIRPGTGFGWGRVRGTASMFPRRVTRWLRTRAGTAMT